MPARESMDKAEEIARRLQSRLHRMEMRDPPPVHFAEWQDMGPTPLEQGIRAAGGVAASYFESRRPKEQDRLNAEYPWATSPTDLSRTAINPHEMVGFRRGGSVAPFVGEPVRVGEDGEELVVDEEGNTQVVGGQGEEVVVPQCPATVISNDDLQRALQRRPELLTLGAQQSAGSSPTVTTNGASQSTAAQGEWTERLPGGRTVAEAAQDLQHGERRAPALKVPDLSINGGGDITAQLEEAGGGRLSIGAGGKLTLARDAQSQPGSSPGMSPALRVPPLSSSEDVGYIPAGQRMQAVLAASAESSPATTQPQPTIDVDRHASRLERQLDRYFQLQDQPARDRNGRLKSALWGALIGGLQSLGQSGDWRAGLAGAGAGAAIGAFSPDFDEKLKRASAIAEQKGLVDDALKIENARYTIAQHRAAAAKDAREDAQKKLTQIRLNNGGHLPLQNPYVQRLLNQAGYENMPVSPPGAPKFNSQNVFQSRGRFYYGRMAEKDGGGYEPRLFELKVGADGETNEVPLSKEDATQLALDIQRGNLSVAEFISRHGREAAEALGLRVTSPDVPGSYTTPEPQVAGDANLLPDSAQVDAVRASQESIPPERRSLPNATRPRSVQPPPVYPPELKQEPRSGGGGHGGRRGGSRGGDSIGESITNNRMLDVQPRFEAAKRRGDRDEAIGIMNEVLQNPATRGQYEGGLDPDGNPWLRRKGPVPQQPKGTINSRVGPRAHATIKRDKYFSAVRRAARDHGVDAATARRWFEALGYSPEQR